jgi:ribose transport system permease protein
MDRIELRDYGIVAPFIVLFVVLSLTASDFFTETNLVNVLDQASIVGIMACGETLCIISGAFDLSVAAVAALSAILAIKASNSIGVWPGMLVGLVAGTAMGLFNGAVVAYGRVNSFIATLATSIIFTGVATVVTNGQIADATNLSFGDLAQPTGLAQITVPTWLWLAVLIITSLLLVRTTYGRALFALGGNQEAARLSGLRVNAVRISVFAISGAGAALAGLALAARTTSAQATTATGLELTAIAAAVVGGTSILGGEGAVWRAGIGVLILTLIGNGFDLLGINSTYQQVVQGGLILFAVGLDQFLRRRR